MATNQAFVLPEWNLSWLCLLFIIRINAAIIMRHGELATYR
jgi:hypothetical protein